MLIINHNHIIPFAKVIAFPLRLFTSFTFWKSLPSATESKITKNLQYAVSWRQNELSICTSVLLFPITYCVYWRLHTEEKMKNYNRTVKFGPGAQPEYNNKKTTSGLWLICISNGNTK